MGCYHHNLWNFEQCRQRARSRPVIAPNTFIIELDAKTYGIQFYGTIIIKIRSNNTYEVDLQGHHERTTMKRVMEYSPIGIYSKRNALFMGDIPYEPGSIFNKQGTLLYKPSDKEQLGLSATIHNCCLVLADKAEEMGNLDMAKRLREAGTGYEEISIDRAPTNI